MRSNMMNRRASTTPADEWIAFKQADWMGDMIRQTIQWLTTHKNDPAADDKLKTLPIASRVGLSALQGPVTKYKTTGNASELSEDLEALLSKKRSLASKEATPSAWEVDNTRNAPEAGCCSEPTADNRKSEQSGIPSAWSVDTRREKPKKATPTSWSVDNDRSKPTTEKPTTTEEQAECKKTASLEIYEPQSDDEIDLIASVSPSWVSRRLATGIMAGGKPRFIIDGEKAVAVINASGEVFDDDQSYPTNKFDSVVNPSKALDNMAEAQAKENTPLDAPKNAAAEGGAEEESEQQTTIDSAVVSLLEACKNEWNSLGEPVNPGTWPKEIERAILALNDGLVAEIQKIQDKLVEGEFYSKNVDEGVSGGSNSLMTSLNVAEAEPDSDMTPELNSEMAEVEPKTSNKKAAVDIPDTRKAIKHTQNLKDEIATKFFEFKKVVQNASDSALVKNVGETLVGLKQSLDEVEKMLAKQLSTLEVAEAQVEEKQKDMKKESKQAAAQCPECEGQGEDCQCNTQKPQQPVQPVKTNPTGHTPKVEKPQTGSPVKQYGLLSSLNLAGTL